VGELVVTCAKCGIQHAFHGSKWENAVESEAWLKQHQRAEHQGEQASARTPKPVSAIHADVNRDDHECVD